MQTPTQAPATAAPPDRPHAPSATEANRRIVRDAFAAWQAGTGPITDVFAPEMVWRIEGRSAASREYRDRQHFIDEVLAPFAARFRAGTPFRPIRIRAVYADGDAVVVLWDGRGVANDGVAYENSYAWIMRLRDGRVIDGTALYDSIAFDELWARVPAAP
jgi:ketosteroid isomerase-like protein